MLTLIVIRRIVLRAIVVPTFFLSSITGLGVPLPGVGLSQAQADSKSSCRVVSKARGLKAKRKYRQAQKLLQGCVASQCTDGQRTSCAGALQKLQTKIPSIVVLATDGSGNDVVDVSVKLDGEVLVEQLDGQAIAVDPGEHQFVFERLGQPPVTRTVKLVKGQKFRPIEIELLPAAPLSSATPVQVPMASVGRWVGGASLGIVGLAGGLGFALAGSNARSEEKELLVCRATPERCHQGRADSVKARYFVANAALGVGVISLGAAVWVLLSGDKETDSNDAQADGLSAAEPASLKFSVQSSVTGSGINLVGSF